MPVLRHLLPAEATAPPAVVDERRAGRQAASGGAPGLRRDQAVSLSVVVPCKNEAANLALLLPRLGAVLSALADEWEVVVVDDGSSDGTAELLADWSRRGGFRLLQLSRNFGKEAALTAGLQAARGDLVVLMDADLQHPPALLPQMLEHWRRGTDMVYAVRAHRQDESGFKRWGARLFYALLNAADRIEVPADAGDFRLMDRCVVDALLALPERNRFMKGLYAWVGFDAVGVPYEPPPRAEGRSHFGPLRLIRLSLAGLTAFTTWPLRAASIAGGALALLSMAYGGYEAVSYLLFGNTVSGWTTLVVGMMFLLGVQLVSIGIVGEYIGRIFDEVKGRPLYLVKRSLGRGLPERRP